MFGKRSGDSPSKDVLAPTQLGRSDAGANQGRQVSRPALLPSVAPLPILVVIRGLPERDWTAVRLRGALKAITTSRAPSSTL